jgi:hypothetical protein
LVNFLIKYIFKLPEELIRGLGNQYQSDSIFAKVYLAELWKCLSFKDKLTSILTLRWQPTEEMIQDSAKLTLKKDLFGSKADYGEKLFELVHWHHSRVWDLNHLNETDKAKSKAFSSMTMLTRTIYREILPVKFNLQIFNRYPEMCILVNSMVVKIPIFSLQHYIDIHMSFTFNSIRKAKHPLAEDLISYIYDLQYIQQKIAISLHEFLRLSIYTEENKKNALLINAEIKAIMGADLVFSYLKASVEKTILLLALTHGIKNLDGKKEHRQKIKALNEKLPDKVKKLFYTQFILEFIQSENLSELNNYRSGILHKKGIADLQPHNYVDNKAAEIPLRKIANVLVDQHSKNTAMLIGTYALLTDELVRLDPPDIKISEIPR